MITHPYWPLTGWAEYLCYEITGYFHADTMALEVWSRTPLPSGNIRRTCVQTPNRPYPSVNLVYTAFGVNPPADWQNSCDNLVQGWNKTGSQGWIGEIGTMRDWGAAPRNGTVLLMPPEPELPLDITAYTTPITGATNVYRSDKITCETSIDSVSWRFRNLGPGPWWWAEKYPDTLRTSLEERPGAGQYSSAYNYLFAKGIGPVDIWWINKDLTGHGSGWEWQLISHS